VGQDCLRRRHGANQRRHRPSLPRHQSVNRRRTLPPDHFSTPDHTIHAQPFTKVWGDGGTSSSDGQFFRAGGHGEARADHNAKYGSEPGVKFYTHVSDRYAPFHSKVIAANASEAAQVLDGLLQHESSIDIREHYTDTAGAIDHVFGLCHMLAFRFAPRIRAAAS
jgi:TnpA family transposase